MNNKFTLILGDSCEKLKGLPDESVDCCITSPPYYGLRDYGTGTWIGGDPNCPHYRTSKINENNQTGHKVMSDKGEAVGDAIYKSVCPLCGAVRVDKQIGLEETPEEYIEKLVNVFREVKRVLKQDGTLWVNIGDTYNSSSRTTPPKQYLQAANKGSYSGAVLGRKVIDSCKQKDLIGIPWMLAFALREDGWYLRQDIIWCLSGGTYLYVKSQKGVQPMMIKDMIRLKPETVKLWNGNKWVNVVSWQKSNFVEDKRQIVLRSGERIQCTGGHKWVLSDGTEKLTSQLNVGDILMSSAFEDENSHNPYLFSKELFWLIGLYIAEGSKSDDCIQIALNSDEIEWVDKIKNIIKGVGGTVTHTIDGNNLNVRIYSQVFFAILHQYVGGKTAKNKHLNNICWSMPNENLKEIVDGYLDGDGSYEKDNNRFRLGFTRNYDWERDLRVLANRLGATLTLKLSTSKIGDKPYKSFSGEWRWGKSNHPNTKNRNEIISINKGSARNYYDICVDDDSHLFSLASGVLTHNCKLNPMPESVRDRFTKSHEYIFLFSKSSKYYFDIDATMEASVTYKDKPKVANLFGGQISNKKEYKLKHKRDVWDIGVNSNSSDHYATYPTEIVENCILSGCKPNGVVLDPFNGSGTTGIVANELERDYIGIELSRKYFDLTKERFDSIGNNCKFIGVTDG